MSARKRIGVLSIGIGAIAIDSILLGLLVPLLPEVEARTGASGSALGLAMAAYAIPIVLLALPLGRLADRLGRRPLLIAGLLLTAVGSLVIAGSSSLEPLVAGRAIQGVGSAASWIAGLALVSDLAKPMRQGQTIGFALAANSAGAIAGPALGGTTGDTLGFAAPFLMVTVAAALLAVLAVLFVPRHVVPTTGRSEQRLRPLATLSRRDVLPAVAVTLGGATSIGMIDVISPLDLEARFGLSAAALGLIFGAAIAFDSLAAPLAGRTSDHIGRPPIASLGLLVIAVSAVLLALPAGTVMAIVGLCVFGAGIGIVFAAAVPWLGEAFGEMDQGTAAGAINFLYALGYAGGPLVAGVLYERSGAALAYWVMAAVAAAGAVAIASKQRAATKAQSA